MPSESPKSTGLPRTTVSLDPFDNEVIQKMADEINKSKSEILRNIINEWIISNPGTLQAKYGINFKDIKREIQLKNDERTIDDDINEIVGFFKRTKSIEIDRLAEKLEMSPKTLTDLLDKYGDQIEEKGLNFRFEADLIIKID